VLLIREKLRGYSACFLLVLKRKRINLMPTDEAVLLWSEVTKLSSPSSRDLSNLQQWMNSSSMGSVFLTGQDRNVWAEGKDLVAIKPGLMDNKVFQVLSETITPLYHYTFGRYHKVWTAPPI